MAWSAERVRPWLGVAVLNVLLATAAYLLVPPHSVATTDRQGYEWIAQHGLAPDCPHTDFCYRVLVPTLVAHTPLPPPLAWGLYPVLANAAAGFALALACARIARPPLEAAVLGTILAQTSFGFTFAIFDPYTPDPAVFLAAALLLLAWITDRPWLALAVGLVGVFAKETVALISVALALAALVPPRLRSWPRWVGQSVLTAAVLLGFHLAMDTLAGWSVATSPAADLTGGSWLALWLRSQQPAQAALLVFIPFGFAWLFAAFGFSSVRAPDRLRRLALGLVAPLLVLVYVQNVERALGNAFLVVIPAAVVFLSEVPFGVALLAAIANGVLTARVGLSTSWLPSTPVLLVLAGLAAAWTVLRARPRLRPAAVATLLTLSLAACAAPGAAPRTPTAPTATTEALATQTVQAADAAVRRLLASNPVATATPSPTPVPRPTCADGIWWYEAAAHVGENRTVQGQVVRARRLDDGTPMLEVGQFYPDPSGLVVLLPSALDGQTYLNRSVCVAGTIQSQDGAPALRTSSVVVVA